MGHKYIKEDDTFSTSRNGTVPKPTQQDVSDDKVLHADGSWGDGGGSGGSSTLDGLDDVDISSLSDGQGLFYDSTEQKWKNADPPSGGGDVTDVLQDGQSVVDEHGVARITTPSVPSDIDDLSDVDLSSPTTDDYLGYDSQTGKWVNKPVSSGGGNVDDVQVNGVSVVDQNKVAQIKGYKEVTKAQYDALPASKESDGILYCIKDTGDLASTMYAPVIYSTEEREIGVWIDGKPLYELTVNVDSLVKNSWVTITEFSSCNIEKLVNFDIMAVANNNEYSDHNLVDNQHNPSISCTNGIISYCVRNNAFTSFTITARYTKTTDVAGSGNWASGGVLPARHYSTNEHIIGTWIDGKPLYEKQFHITSIIANDNWQLIGNVAIKLLIDYECIGITSGGRSGNQTSFRGDKNTPQIQGDNTNGNLYYALISETSISELYITARYTKTTD